MEKNAYVRVIIAGLLLGGLSSASACGSSDENDSNGARGGSAGSAGKGGGGMDASAPDPVECGTTMCEPLVLPIPGAPPVEACCTADGGCGLDSTVLEAFGPTFEERCQARDQPGELDENCPNSTSAMVEGGLNIEFPGCCRADGRCGYMLDTLFGVYPIGLGCVDSEPFLEGGTPAACGDGSGGAAGAGAGGTPGGGGTPADGGASGSPGSSNDGGASGATSASSGGAAGTPGGGAGGV
jgi:hypothetical protein